MSADLAPEFEAIDFTTDLGEVGDAAEAESKQQAAEIVEFAQHPAWKRMKALMEAKVQSYRTPDITFTGDLEAVGRTYLVSQAVAGELHAILVEMEAIYAEHGHH